MTSVAACASDTCPICLDEYGNGHRLSFCPCAAKHVFHSGCVKPWVRDNHNCPLCRQAVAKVRKFKMKKPVIIDLSGTDPVAVPPPGNGEQEQPIDEAPSLFEQLVRAQRQIQGQRGDEELDDAAVLQMVHGAEALQCTCAGRAAHAPFETRNYPSRRQRCHRCRELHHHLQCCTACPRRYCDACADATPSSATI